ncbi:MAG: ABC transporter permease [Bacillota bacterium]|nr:ABC transporter permease [Bacillota bacterium]
MSIVTKFILKNISEKKFRSFLILFSIIISTALFFSSNAITNSVGKMFTERVKSFYGSTDVLVQSNSNSASPFFTMDKIGRFSGKIDSVTGIVQGSANYIYNKNETLNFTMIGIDYSGYSKINNIDLEGKTFPAKFDGKLAIIGQRTANKYGLHTGDTVHLEMNGVNTNFTIAGIAKQTGLFMNDGITKFIIVPRNELGSLYGSGGKVNLALIKLKSRQDTKQFISDLSKEYKNYTVKEPYTKEELSSLTGGMATGLLIMSIMIAAISIFIIYTSFKVLTMERLPVTGTFRSVGATGKMTNLVMMAESTIYGILGGLAGCLLGIGVLYVLTTLTGSDMLSSNTSIPGNSDGGNVAISFTAAQMGFSFGFAVILSFISSIIPIIKISRIPLKDIVLNNIEVKNRKSRKRLFIGIAIVTAALIGPPLFPFSIAGITDIFCIIFTIAAVILLIPYITSACTILLEKVFGKFFGNEGILASKNVRGSKSIVNNICLLAVGISSLIMMNTAGGSEVAMLTKLYKSADFQVWITSMPNADKSMTDSIKSIDGVSDVYPIYRASKILIDGTNGRSLGLLDGVDKAKFQQYWKLDWYGDGNKLLNGLDTGRNIILANTMEKVLKVKEGSEITLKFPSGNRVYKVIGFANTTIGDGSYGLISENNLKTDTGMKYYNNIFIKTGKNPNAVKQEILDKFAGVKPALKTVVQMEQDDRDALGNTFTILNGLSIVTLIVSIFGMLNNLIISFIERKRSLAVLKSVGMSKRQIIKMVFIEAIAGGIIGSMAGILAGLLLVRNIPFTMEAMDMFISVQYPSWSLLLDAFIGMAIFTAAAISPAIKSSKLKIIESLKYE